MVACMAGTLTVHAVAFGVGRDSHVYLRRFSLGMASLRGLRRATMGWLHEVRAKAWTATSADAAPFLEAYSLDLFSYRAGFCT